MSGQLVYFLPGRQTANRGTAQAAGLGYLFEGDEGVAYAGTSAGPEGLAGVYFTVPNGRREKRDPRAGERATWHRLPGLEAWVGVVDRVTPADVARPAQVLGHQVQLADGQDWLVPVARLVNGEPGLPTALACDQEGTWKAGPVVPRHRALWEAGLQVWELLRGAEEGAVALDLGAQAATAVLALGTNYRLGPGEVSALGLLDTSSLAAALRALIDWPVWVRLMEELRLGEAEAAGPS